MERIQSFPPIVDYQSRILILGSIPGVKSLEMQQYYAHPQNNFWRIIFNILDETYLLDYAERISFLKENRIALWDVIESCERKGSTDSTIKNEEENDIIGLLTNYPNIKAIFCNGQKSYKNLSKILKDKINIPVFILPSTSPLHTISLEKKKEQWQKILDFL